MGLVCETVSVLQVEELDSPEQLSSIHREWAELWAQCPSATPFQSPHWLIPWCRHFASDRTLGFAFRRDSALVGLAVFTVADRFDGAKELLLAGNGITDYLGIVFEAEMLRLYGLRAGSQVIATLYGFADGRSLFYYLGGFDPEYSGFSPGTILIGQAIRDAMEQGLRAFDFLRGRETYKYLWGAKGQLNYRRRLWPSASNR